jgi:hypothetical protein
MDFADAFAQVKGKLGAESREAKSVAPLRDRSEEVKPALSNAAKSSRVASPKVFPFSGLFQLSR